MNNKALVKLSNLSGSNGNAPEDKTGGMGVPASAKVQCK